MNLSCMSHALTGYAIAPENPDFRPQQMDIMKATMAGLDVLGLVATGGGKSLCFQLPAALDDGGLTVVVAPLLPLIDDQVVSLNTVRYSVHNRPLALHALAPHSHAHHTPTTLACWHRPTVCDLGDR